MGQDPLNMPYEVWCANIAPKLKNIRKCLWKQGFFDDFSSILTVFCSLYNLRAILAQKENTFICRKKNVIFWHPWDPWGRINSGKNVFWVQTATVLSGTPNFFGPSYFEAALVALKYDFEIQKFAIFDVLSNDSGKIYKEILQSIFD